MEFHKQEWRDEYYEMRKDQLSQSRIKLLAVGPRSASQDWILKAMYEDWKQLTAYKESLNYESGKTAGNVED
jgi:hypothetical protein|tara:strand:- start:456 stop:671 length:216 start_codon:yes stop_codon:yes gene_type:complete